MPKSKNPDAYPQEYLAIAKHVLETGLPLEKKIPIKRARYIQADFHAFGRALSHSKQTEFASAIQRIVCKILQVDDDYGTLVFAPRGAADKPVAEILSSFLDDIILQPEQSSTSESSDVLDMFRS